MEKYKYIETNSDLFKVLQKICKLDYFQYHKDNMVIEKEIKVNGKKNYKIRCEWFDELQSGYDFWEIIQEQSNIMGGVQSNYATTN